MAINFCTISATTIDTFCGAQRSKVLTRLIAEARPVQPIVVGGGGAKIERPASTWFEPRVELPSIEFEQPYITVVVRDMFGEPASQTLQTQSPLEFVVIHNLDFNSECESTAEAVTINISGLEI